MMNLLSYVGMNLQTEVCVWTLMGIVRTIFDATLFKVNSNLKEVWLMDMPEELMMSIQRIIRTVISGVILVQCFTVHAYLASYVVLLYPVFLEDRATLVLPWLLLAAIRQLLCELSSLALGLAVCVLLGASKPPCVKFVLTKIFSIMGYLYMWMLVLNYYHFLKIAAAFKSIPAALASSSIEDYGLELAIRRRRTKSLFNEQMLRQTLVTNYYKTAPFNTRNFSVTNLETESINTEIPFLKNDVYRLNTQRDSSEIGNLHDLFGVDISIPRDSDRILEQFVLMLLRVSSCLKNEEADSIISLVGKRSTEVLPNYLDCSTDIENDASVSVQKNSATSSYITNFPQIFQKPESDSLLFQSSERAYDIKPIENKNIIRTSFKAVTFSPNPNKEVTIEIEKSVYYKTVNNMSTETEVGPDNNKCISLKQRVESINVSNTSVFNNGEENSQKIVLDKSKNYVNETPEKLETKYKQIDKSKSVNSLKRNDSLRTNIHKNALKIKRSQTNSSQNETEKGACSNITCDNFGNTSQPSTSAIKIKNNNKNINSTNK